LRAALFATDEESLIAFRRMRRQNARSPQDSFTQENSNYDSAFYTPDVFAYSDGCWCDGNSSCLVRG